MFLATARAAPTATECKEERRLGINECKNVMYGRSPSASCCQRIRVSHVECVCPAITPKLAALIDVNRFIRLIQGCGRRVPRHFKCGSITTP
ncbi:bifunctional inhibitor/plant lipid transfer protein/seed storage helical domain-containing protein [Tanacetum coccineum]